MKSSALSRRQFLQLSASVASVSLLAACITPAAPSGEEAPASSTSTIEIWSYPRTENDAEIVFAPMMEKIRRSPSRYYTGS